MKKHIIKSIAFSCIIFLFAKEGFESGNNHISNSIGNRQIMPQITKKRKFVTMPFDSMMCINLEKLEQMVYVPAFCQFVEEGSLFLLDRSTFLIHKFTTQNNWKTYAHSVFGYGKGQGPGEFINPTDFKIINEKIFVADPQVGSIEIYTTDGNYIKRITIEARANKINPYQLIPYRDSKLIVERMGYPIDNLFHFCDFNGNIIKGFGVYIDYSQLDNAVYHDNRLSKLFNENCFYYLPYYLGFVGLFKDDILLFARETVDGVQKPKIIKKEIMSGVIASKLDKRLETAVRHAINDNYIIIQAYDRESKIFFHDIYSLKDFSYLFSISNFPKTNDFDTIRDLLVCSLNNKLTIYKIKKLNSLIQMQIEKIHSKD